MLDADRSVPEARRPGQGCKSWTPEEGTPQGAVLSPLLSNIYLDPLDHLHGQRGLRDGAVRRRLRDPVPERGRGRSRRLERGASVDGASRPDAAPGRRPGSWTPTRRGGFDFLGYHFERGMIAGRARRAWRSSRTRSAAKTQRTQRHEPCSDHRRRQPHVCAAGLSTSNTATAPRLARWTAGSACACAASCANVAGGRGRGRGADHQRWPNAFFAEQGLFCSDTQPMRWPVNPLGGKPPTGEPDAGNPPVRFGGRGGRTQPALPTPIFGASTPPIFGTVTHAPGAHPCA